MKAKTTTEKKFDAVKMMRDIRDKIDKETEGMSYEQLQDYYRQSRKENQRKAGS